MMRVAMVYIPTVSVDVESNFTLNSILYTRTHARTGERVSVGAFQVPGGQGSMCTIHKPRAVCTVTTHFSNSLLCRDSMNPFSM